MPASSSPNHERLHFRPVRFSYLLAAFFVLLALSALGPLLGLEPGSQIGRIALNLTLIALLGSAALSVEPSRKALWIFRLLAALTMILLLSTIAVPGYWSAVLSHLIGVIFLGWTIYLILKLVFSARRVDFEVICASLCVYMLLGLLWALLYSLVETVLPGSFVIPTVDEGLSHRDGGFSIALYYSYVTLTTLGYGEVNPVSDPARILAILEAILGQLFLVVLVARLVAVNVSQGMGPTDTQSG